MAEVKVTIEKVRKVMHHPNADRLDLVTVRGWQVIVGRDQYKEGDLCIYVPIDSVLPVDLAHDWDVAKYLRGNMRIRTLKLRGSVSQGLVVALGNNSVAIEGDNVTDLLGIKKWEPKGKPGRGMLVNDRNPDRTTPWFPRYTSIDHLDNNPMAFEDEDWVVVNEKRHGTNGRMGYVRIARKSLVQRLLEFVHGLKRGLGWKHCHYTALGRYLHVGSHNVIRQYHPQDLYWKAALKLQLQMKARVPLDYVFFYEISGPGVQTGFDYGVEEGDDFIAEIIDIYDSVTGRYLSTTEVANLCYRYGLPEAPTMCVGEWRLVKEIYESYADGKATGANHIREGVVIKRMGEGNRKIFKFLSPDYLIHQGKQKQEDATEWH
jgi:RNA ligase (TIGR02306 family)